MHVVEDDIDMCGQPLRKRNEKRKRDSGGSYGSYSFITFQDEGLSKKRTLDKNNNNRTQNHCGWSNNEVLQNTIHNNMHLPWPSTTMLSHVTNPRNSLGSTNILGTNTLDVNILGASTLGTNILCANTLGTFGNNTLGNNALGNNTLVTGVSPLDVQTKSNGWNNELGLCISIRTLSGKAVEIRIKPTDHVKDIKQLIYCNEGIPPEQQRLVFKGHVMADEKHVCDYGVLNGSLIHMVLALRGGQTSFLCGLVILGDDTL